MRWQGEIALYRTCATRCLLKQAGSPGQFRDMEGWYIGFFLMWSWRGNAAELSHPTRLNLDLDFGHLATTEFTSAFQDRHPIPDQHPSRVSKG